MNLFRLVLFLILRRLHGVTLVTATEMSSIHLEKEVETEADRCARREVWTNAGMCKEDPVHLGNSNNSSRLKGMCCRGRRWKRRKKTNRKKKQPGKRPENLLALGSQRQEASEMYLTGGPLKKKEKSDGDCRQVKVGEIEEQPI